MTFKGNCPITTKIILDRHILEQVCRSNYLGRDISCGNEVDWDNKLAEFISICGTIRRRLKNIRKRIGT